MRVVLDTNVLVSGLLNPHGAPGRIVDLLTSGAITLLVDDRILAEYNAVLRRPEFPFLKQDVDTLLHYIAGESECVVARPLLIDLSDGQDLPFIEVAAAAAAQILITGNERHFRAAASRLSLKVCPPATFLALWEGQERVAAQQARPRRE